jgi:RimJ/RimL family protein N-acetyltransferase
VRLETIAEAHRDGLREAAEREWHIHRYTNMATFGFDRWFDMALETQTEVPFVVIANGAPAGSSRYLNVEPMHKRVEIGWTWLERAHWGTGANVEAKYLLLRHAFEVLGCRRVEFKTDALNERARGALAALPSRFEGIHRKHMLVRDGERRDSAWYAVIDDDWPEVRSALERRLL